MEAEGFFDIKNFNAIKEVDTQKYIWLDQMEWLSRDEIINYEYDEDRSNLVIPFAFNGGGDVWGWYMYDKSFMPVVFCLHDDYEASYYAASFEEALFRQVLEFCCDCNFYIGEGKSYQMDLHEARVNLTNWRNKFERWFKKEWLAEVDLILRVPLKFYEDPCQKSGKGYYVLITPEECEHLIKKYLDFDLINKTFYWKRED